MVVADVILMAVEVAEVAVVGVGVEKAGGPDEFERRLVDGCNELLEAGRLALRAEYLAKSPDVIIRE